MWKTTGNHLIADTVKHLIKKDYQIGKLHYNLAMFAHASQAFSTSTVPIPKIYY